MNAEQAVTQVINLVSTWLRRVAALGLVALILIKVLSAFPQLPALASIASIDWQAFGVFVAGTAYALLHGKG